MRRSLVIIMALFAVVFFTGEVFSATYDLTGTWNCNVLDIQGTCTITQNGDNFTLALDPGAFVCDPPGTCNFTGAVAGAEYTGTTGHVPTDDEGGITVCTLIFTASSSTSAAGYGTATYIHPEGQIPWSGSITLSKDGGALPENHPPNKPALLAPENGAANAALTPLMKTGSFSDPDLGNTHLKTEWQISTETGFSTPLLQITSANQLTSMTVPVFVLNEGNTYYWRARFYDNHSAASEWSDIYSFSTLTTSNDQNSNGIPDSQEVDDSVDLDNDGTPDIEQNDIKSVDTVVGDGQMGVSRKDHSTITSISMIESIDPAAISALGGPSMPFGLIAIKLEVTNPGDTAEATVYFSKAAPNGAKWYKYDAISDWSDYSEYATFSNDRKSAVLQFKDGGYGDADGVANGIIVDPSGFGLGTMVTSNLWIRAVINTVEKGAIDAVWQKGGEDTTSRGDRVVWGYFYADPNDVSWGSINNPEVFVKVWYDAGGRVDVNFFHVSVPDIEVYSEYNGVQLQGTTTTNTRYIRQYYNDYGNNGLDENFEDGIPVSGYTQTNSPVGYSTINNLSIGAMINTVEAIGSIDALWTLGGTDTTSRGDQVVWGHFYANPNDVSWGSQNNPELFVKIWFDASGRIDVNYFHVSVPDIEVYSDYGSDGIYDTKGTTIMDDRYIRHEYTKQ